MSNHLPSTDVIWTSSLSQKVLTHLVDLVPHWSKRDRPLARSLSRRGRNSEGPKERRRSPSFLLWVTIQLWRPQSIMKARYSRQALLLLLQMIVDYDLAIKFWVSYLFLEHFQELNHGSISIGFVQLSKNIRCRGMEENVTSFEDVILE